MNRDYVSSAVANTETQAVLLNETETNAVVIRLRERLGVDVTRPAPWDAKAAPEGKRRPDGWELIPRYVGTEGCLLFLESAHEMWKFQNGSDLLRVLEDCPAVEFFVCDEPASYLLCCNHHDFVIGWGRAASWVEGL